MANTKIQSEQIADSAIVTDRIAADAVTTAKIADNVALGGSPTTTTQSASDNSTKIATTAYVTTAVANLIDSAPSTLNTLNEIAAALNDDANFNTTVTNSIAAKLPLAGGTMTGALNMGSQQITNAGTIASGVITSTGASSGRYTGLEVVNSTNAGGTETAIGLGVVSASTNACDVKLVANRVGANSGSDFYIEQTDSSGSQQETFRITESGNATFAGTISSGTHQLNDGQLNVHSSGASAVIGSIGNTANDINIFSTTAGHNGLRMHVNGILPTDNSGTIIDADADLGDPNYRFKDLYLSGTANSDKIRITNTSDAALSSTDHAIQIGATSGQNLIIDNNEVLSRNNGATSYLHLQADGGTVSVGAGTTANMTISGTLSSGNYTSSGSITSTDGSGSVVISGDSSSNTYIASSGQIRIRPEGTTVNKIILDASYLHAPLFSTANGTAGIGVSLGDVNDAELGPGYLTLARDDTADADSILMTKNGSLHTKLQTINNAFVVHAEGSDIHFKTNQGGTAANLNFSGSVPSLKPFDSNNGQIDLGTAGAKFRSLYVNYLGAAADLRYLKGVFRKSITVSKTFTPLFKIDGGTLASSFQFTACGTANSVVVNAKAEVLVNHYFDCSVRSIGGSYTEAKVKIVSNNNEDCTVYLAINGVNAASLAIEVETFNNEGVSFDVSSPDTAAHFIHTIVAGSSESHTGTMASGAGTTTGYS